MALSACISPRFTVDFLGSGSKPRIQASVTGDAANALDTDFKEGEGMPSHKTNESREDYLECIFLLTRKKGFCRSVDVANELEVSKPSVSAAVSKLQSGGYLYMDDDRTLHLTQLGEQTARTVYDRHVTLKEMLEKAGVASELAEQEACRMEHVISDDSISKLKKAIQNRT